MRKYIRKAAAVGIALAMLSLPLPIAKAMPDILPAAEITEGMTGTAYTVVDSSGEIQPFQVDVVGILQQGKGSSPMIMAKAYGSVIESTGGILQGMSGSPVYVDDLLVGAVAAGIKEMSPYTFFITPIEEMLPLWQLPDTMARIQFRGIDLKKAAEEREKAAQAEQEKEKKKEKDKNKDKDKDKSKKEHKSSDKGNKNEKNKKDSSGKGKKDADAPEKTQESPASENESEKEVASSPANAEAPAKESAPPEQNPDAAAKETADGDTSKDTEPKVALFASGFTPESLDFLASTCPALGSGRFYSAGAPSGALGGVSYDAELTPGGAFGVAVVYGDFAVGSTGTVTAVDGNRILGFGHPFLHQGNVNYFMTDASVIGTVSGQSNGMKVATIGSIIGRINQDRSTGVSGIIGTFPESVPVHVTVKDSSLGREESYSARIAYNETLLPQLGAGIAYAALSKTADSLDGSTATVQFTIRTDALENGTLDRKNMFYNTSDVGQIAVLELAQAINIICSNRDQSSSILDLQVNINLDSERRTATIISAVPDKTKVKPGETVNFKTTIKPYRSDKEVLTIPYKVPATQPTGTLNLDVRGGSLIPMSQAALLQQAGLVIAQDEDKSPSTKEQLEAFASSGRNNEIIIAPGAVTEPASEREQEKAIKKAVKEAKEREKNRKVSLLGSSSEEKSSPETKFETKYIIENVVRASLEIVKK